MTHIKIFSNYNFLICGKEFEDEVCDFCYVDVFLENNEKCYLKFFPLEQSNFSIPFCICINNFENKVECDAQNIKIYKVLSHYEIFVEPYILNTKNSCTSKTLQIAKSTCKINVWENKIEFLTNKFCHSENISITSPSFESIGGCAIIYGKHKNSNACIIFCCNSKICKTIFYDQLEIDNKKLKLLCNLQTFPEHKVLQTYSFSENEFSLQDIELYCNPTQNRQQYPTEIIPYLFLECIRAKDFVFAKKFTSEALETFSANAYQNYFGDFERISLYSTKPLIYILYNNKTATVFEFNVNNDKITDINKI